MIKQWVAAVFFVYTAASLGVSAAERQEHSKAELEKEYYAGSFRAVGRDSFPVLFNPAMGTVAEGDRFIRPNDWVIGIALDGEAKAYPVMVMGFHELINDVVAGHPITVCW